MASERADINLPISPHLLRQSVASNDAFLKRRSAEDIQRRGTWASVRSVAVYERHGAIMRSIQTLGSVRMRRLRLEAAAFPHKLKAALMKKSK